MIKKLIRWYINIADKKFHKKNGLVIIPGCKNELFYINTHSYEGNERKLSDGVVINKGDIIMEIHMNNQKVDEVNDIKAIMKAMKEAMVALADVFVNDERFNKATAVYGNTLLYPIASRFGFEVIEIEKESYSKGVNLWENIIKYAYSEKGKKLDNRVSKEIWFSRDSLIKKYGEK